MTWKRYRPVVLLALVGAAITFGLIYGPAVLDTDSETGSLEDPVVKYDHPSIEITLQNDTARLGNTITFAVENTGDSGVNPGCGFQWKVERRVDSEWQTVVNTYNTLLCRTIIEPGDTHTQNVTLSAPEMGGEHYEVQTDLVPGTYRFVVLTPMVGPAVRFEVHPATDSS